LRALFVANPFADLRFGFFEVVLSVGQRRRRRRRIPESAGKQQQKKKKLLLE
jgi:hypothetical protein